MHFCSSAAYLIDKMETLKGDENRDCEMEGENLREDSVQQKVTGQMLKAKEIETSMQTEINTFSLNI